MGSLDRHIDWEKSPADPWVLAAAQYGRLAAWQLRALGVPRTLVESWLRAERLLPDRRGVYVAPGVPEQREGRWMSAVLACGPDALLSHQSAGAHRGILLADKTDVDVTAPRSRHEQEGIDLHRPRTMPARDTHKGIPITGPTQILIDLARTFTQANLERALGEAELLGVLDEDAVTRRGGPRIVRILEGHETGGATIPKNVMERRFRAIVREAGLPEPEMHAELLGYEIDFLWPDCNLAVEADGRTVHARRAAFARDRVRDRALQLAGFIALRYTYTEITREPELVRAGILRALRPVRAAVAAR